MTSDADPRESSWSSSLTIRNFLCEHSMDFPNDFNSAVVSCSGPRPTLHVFGITPCGKKACVHIHGVLPYIVLRVGGELTSRIERLMRGKLNRILHREILRKKNESTEAVESRISSENLIPKDYVYRIEAFQARSIYGFHPEEETFARVYLTSNVHCMQLFTALMREVEQNPGLQPFEAHYPFILQFFMDHSLFGMDLIHLSNVRYRIASDESKSKDYVRGIGLLSPLEPMTMCEIECDVYSTDIMNSDMHKSNVHSSNPGLEYIWKEEAVRCELQQRPLEDTFNSYTPRPYPKIKNETKLLNKLRQCLRDMRVKGRISLVHQNLTQGLNDSVVGVSIHDSGFSVHSTAETIWSQDADQEWDVVPQPINGMEEQMPDYGSVDPDGDEDDEMEENMNALASPQLVDLDKEYESAHGSNKIAHNSEVETEEEHHSEGPLPKRFKTNSDAETVESDWDPVSSSSDDDICSSTSNSEISDNDNCKFEWYRIKKELPLKCRATGKNNALCSTKIPSSAQTKQSKYFPVEKSVHINFLMVDSPLDGTDVHNMTSPDEIPNQDGEVSEVTFLTVASLEIVTNTSNSMPSAWEDPLVGVSISVFNDVCRSLQPTLHQFITTLNPTLMPEQMNCQCVESEKDIINRVVGIIRKFDPDILVGYDIDRLSWGYLMKRSDALGLSSFNGKIGRYKSDSSTYMNRDGLITAPRGRLMEAVWRVVRRDLQLRAYDRGTACLKVLKRKIPVLDERTLGNMITSSDRRLVFSAVRHLLRLSFLNVSLLNEMDFFFRNAEMARVYGIQFHEVWSRGSQLRVESMLLRLARVKSFVAPSISVSQRTKMCAPEQLQLIVEPKSGVYHDPVIVLDFQSLYPSMSIAYNYCFSSIIHLNSMYEEADDTIELGATRYSVPKETLVGAVASRLVHSSPLSAIFAKNELHSGLIPTLLKEVLGARIMIKTSMKHTKSKRLLRILDARQLALKLVANVTYGYTAANWSGRMPCVEVADAILGKGRETLERAIAMVQNGDYRGAEVIYGDTDSMFVRVKGLSTTEAFEIGKRIAEDVTNDNPVPIVLKLEKVYAGCVLETKKRYAGWKLEFPEDVGCLESKGLETIRRDTCPVVAKFLERSLKLIFQRRYSDFSRFLQSKLANVDKLPFTDFVFCKEYRGGYAANAHVPQKKIAAQLVETSPSHVLMHGERVPYVVVQGDIGANVISSVRSVDEFVRNRSLKINYSYYIRAHIVAALKRVTDLINIKIQWEFSSGTCYSEGCRIVGRKPWCVRCGGASPTVVSTAFDVRLSDAARCELQRVCDNCLQLKFSNGVHCFNYSCAVRQGLSQIDRSGAVEAFAKHSLNAAP